MITQQDHFMRRHIGPRDHEIPKMLKEIGVDSLKKLIKETIPNDIILNKPIDIHNGISEHAFLENIKEIAKRNQQFKSFIGLGYYNTIMPAVIKRNILENPAWYTPYTPYQAEISQGRLEALLNFQTMVIDMTGMELANASLLDEASAAAEAMFMMYNLRSRKAVQNEYKSFFVDNNVFPQTIDVLKTRANSLGIDLHTGDFNDFEMENRFFGAIVQYPDSNGEIHDYTAFTKQAREKEVMVAVTADLMSLVMLQPPGEWGADIAFGSTQRFGIPLGYGGPHAAYFASWNKYKRRMPGRIIGVTKDKNDELGLRMALQTREQHIKREKATSNICTAQALLATIAGMYATYHGSEGLKNIASTIHQKAVTLESRLIEIGFKQLNSNYFDTLLIELSDQLSALDIQKIALERKINFHYFDNKHIGISIDEATTQSDIDLIIEIFSIAGFKKFKPLEKMVDKIRIDKQFLRKSAILTQYTFNQYHSETEMMRYMKRLEQKDFSLVHSMIPLGSCTMKLNAAAEMLPLSWDEFANIHPFVPLEQAEGYHELIYELGKYLIKITGLGGVSFQPNSGAMGEYTGLMVIRQYHLFNNEPQRKVVLIPSSAHGTNPASGIMAGMEVVIVECDENGNIDVDQLRSLAETHKDNLAGFMVTYPSTHGVFEKRIKEMVDIIHDNGGLVYMDGANLNALNGLTNLAEIGIDVCHLNLHKTFAIPHGGGGPGMGPIAVAEHLVQFLPTHPLVQTGGTNGMHAVTASPWGSPYILPISYGYIKMMGGEGITQTANIAILNANYLAKKLSGYFKILYSNEKGRVAHEMIIDCRPFRESAGISETDIAKRLMDYGFHAPTLSFPVHGTLMIEPTESESLQELDRFVEAMASIYNEIKEVETGKADKEDNVLKNAPHTVREVCSDEWTHAYSRQKAAYPLDWLKEKKFWPAVGRVDDAYGDRNLICSCEPVNEASSLKMV